MKALLQRVQSASVTIDGQITAEIGQGILVLLGVMQGDTATQADFLVKKLTELRIFTDDEGKMNQSLLDVDGEMLVVSNFTLGADCKKGRRPSYIKSAPPALAEDLYEYFLRQASAGPIKRVVSGTFGADMQVQLINDGPVTIMIDTEEIGK